MTLERNIANSFQMDDQTWSRHANPWSVCIRFTVLPLLIVSIWSRVWLGWLSIFPIAIALIWMWLNPRLFPKPQTTNNWASKAVLGERVWLNRGAEGNRVAGRIPVPKHHQRVPNILSIVSALGIPFLILGLVNLEIYPTLMGIILVNLGKLWFIDRMVWLFEDMKDDNSLYRSWLY
ncbi:MAG: hypothetical protein QNJ70_02855 [Xenococcaceae cyanobacterium MO_207.B15]|nr:hypothetical protein [Xenococcaceae cyanobacterium MO_207.B15]